MGVYECLHPCEGGKPALGSWSVYPDTVVGLELVDRAVWGEVGSDRVVGLRLLRVSVYCRGSRGEVWGPGACW